MPIRIFEPSMFQGTPWYMGPANAQAMADYCNKIVEEAKEQAYLKEEEIRKDVEGCEI